MTTNPSSAQCWTAWITAAAVLGMSAGIAGEASASSHMDAPLITFDDPANTTDVYAFRSNDPETGTPYLTTALAVYPFEEPGIGPNNYRFDDRVTYNIHVALGDNVGRGRADLTYSFSFDTTFAQTDTIRQTYLDVVEAAGDAFPDGLNLRQTYRLTKSARGGRKQVLGRGLRVAPNNQGLVTPAYNTGNDGNRPAKGGVTSSDALDPLTRSGISRLDDGYVAFAGQRDDGFYADIQSIFDLDFTFGRASGTPSKPFDSQGGFNVHMIALNIPLAELGDAQIAGVYATTTRGRRQVARQGNPLFNEALVALRDKDRYNTSQPRGDARRFQQYADDPELSRLLGVTPIIPGLITSIFIPDVIKVDLTTEAARLAGTDGFNRLGVFGGDVLHSTFQDPFDNGGFIPGGWPNGRRFGDDVVDIAVIALGAAGAGPDFSGVDVDRVTENDITFNQVFPYAATPLNGRNHGHH